MAVLRTEFESLLLADPARTRNVVHVGVTQPTPVEESAYGRLFLVVEIGSPDPRNQEIIAALQEELRTAYYRSSALSVEGAFETALQHANERLHKFVTDGVTGWLDHFNASVAVLKHDHLSLSTVGRINAYLFRGPRILDIVNASGRGSEERNPIKLFSSILSGRLQADDRLVLCTPTLLDYFSLEKIKRLVHDDPPTAAVAKIEAMLLATPNPAVIGALVFACFAEDRAPITAPPLVDNRLPVPLPTAPQRSMEDLIAKERATEQLLSPSVMPNVRGFLHDFWTSVSTFVRTRLFRRPPRRRLPPSLHSETPSTRRPSVLPRGLRRLTAQILLAVMSLPRRLGDLLRRRDRVASSVRHLPDRTTSHARRFVAWLQSLTGLQRLVFVAALVALFIFTQSVIGSLSNRSSRLRGTAAETARTQIADQTERAAAAVSYGDYSGAKKLVDEATVLLKRLGQPSRQDRGAQATLTANLETVRQQIRRVRTAPATRLADLRASLRGATATSLAATKRQLIITTSAPGSIIADLAGKLMDGPTLPTVATYALTLDDRTIVSGNTQQLTLIDLRANTAVTADLTAPNADRGVVAGSAFQSRLYLLDAKNSSILRASRSGSTITAAQWLKDTLDLRNGTAIAVDGSIYLTDASGRLITLVAGRRTDAAFETVDPALARPTAIWTNASSPSLFVLEPSKKRLLEFVKSTGKLVAQHVADAFEDSRGLVVDPSTRMAYVVTASELWRIEL